MRLIKDEAAKREATIDFVSSLSIQNPIHKALAKQALPEILDTVSPRTDEVVKQLVQDPAFQYWIYEMPKIRSLIHRCAQLDVEVSSSGFPAHPIQSLLQNAAAWEYFARKDNLTWLLVDQFQALDSPFQNNLLPQLCSGGIVSQVWRHSKLSDDLIKTVVDWKQAETRAICYAKLIGSAPEDRWNQLALEPDRLQLYLNTTLSSKTRVAFISNCLTSQPYRAWLSRAKADQALVKLVDEQAAQGEVAFESLYYNASYVLFLANTNHLDTWFQFAESSPERQEKCVRGVLYNLPTTLRATLAPHADRVIKLVENQQDAYLRTSIVSSLLMTPQAVKEYASRGQLTELFTKIHASGGGQASGFFSAGPLTEQLLVSMKEHDGVTQLLRGLRDLPEPQTRPILTLLMQPALADVLASGAQQELLMEVAMARPQLGLQLLSYPPLAASMIEKGYLEKCLELASSVDRRDNLISQLLTNPAVLSYYTKQRQLGQLVKLFDTLSPRDLRDRSLQSLLLNQAAGEAVCKELGVNEAYELASSITSENSRAISRAYVVISASSLQPLPKSWLDQLIVDAKLLGVIGNSVRSRLLQDELMKQLISAGLFDDVKQLIEEASSAKYANEVVGIETRFYAMPVVFEHLVHSGHSEQFFEQLNNRWKRDELVALVRGALATETGRKLLFGAEGFPRLLKTTESLTLIDQTYFWQSLGSQPQFCRILLDAVNGTTLLTYLAKEPQFHWPLSSLIHSSFSHPQLVEALDHIDLLAALQESLPQLNEACREAISVNLATNMPATWKLVGQGKLSALVQLIECIPDVQRREERLSTWIVRDGGVLSALLAHDRSADALELLKRTKIHTLDRLGRDLAIRAASGELQAELQRVEGLARPAIADETWWHVNAYRCLQQPDKAKQIAIAANDRALQASLALEAGDWTNAVSLLSAGPCPLPGLMPRNEQENLIEQQTLLMLSHLYLNQFELAEQCLDRLIVVRDKTSDGYSQSRCVNAMIMGGRIDEALKYTDKNFPQRSLGLRPQQLYLQPLVDYALSHNSDATAILNDMSQRAENEATLSFWMAGLIDVLDRGGQSELAERLHKAVIDRLKPNNSKTGSIFWYANQLFVHRQMDRYWASLAEVDNVTLAFRAAVLPEDPKRLRQDPDRLRQEQQKGLLLAILNRAIISTDPKDRPAIIAALQQIDGYISANQFPQQELDKWVKQSLDSPQGPYVLNNVRFAIGYTCLQQGDREHALRLLDPIAVESVYAAESLALDAWRRKDWNAAANYFASLVEQNPTKLDASYLNAVAKQRAADNPDMIARADQERQAATKALYQPSAMLNLAYMLYELDEKELGRQFTEKTLRTSPADFWDHLQATKLMLIHSNSPEEQIQWGRQWQLAQSRYLRRAYEQTELLRFPTMIYAAEAELGFAAMKWDVVQRQLEWHQQCFSRDKAFNATWSARLKQSGQEALAKELFPDS